MFGEKKMIRTSRKFSLLTLAIFLILCLFSTLPVMAVEKTQREMKIGIIGAMKPEVDILKKI